MTGEKSYKLYDLEFHMVFSSRDVWFHEEVFPFSKGSKNMMITSDSQFIAPQDILTDDDVADTTFTYTTTPAPDVKISSSDHILVGHFDPDVVSAASGSTDTYTLPTSHSTRSSKPSTWLKDYVTCIVSPASFSSIACSPSIGTNGQYA